MTGRELIEAIKRYNLEDSEIIPNNLLDKYRSKDQPINGEYIRFTPADPKHEGYDYDVLWISNDYISNDIVYNVAGSRTYGIFSKAEEELWTPTSL